MNANHLLTENDQKFVVF